MSITTGAQITKYYELYQSIDVTFTKEVIHASGILTQQVFLKCMGEQWPCVLYSTSFAGAKVIASVKPALFDKIRKANNLVSIRYSFRDTIKSDPITFFIAGKVSGFAPYNQGTGDLQFLTVLFTQRPPDPLIEIMGHLLEANVNSTKRREERVLMNPEACRKIGIVTKETLLFVQGVPRKCILRDISFSGAKVIIVGIAKFLLAKPCILRMEMDDPRETYDIKGKVVRSEDVEGRKDLTAIAICFEAASVPMFYKMHLSDYLSQIRKPGLSKADGQDADKQKSEQQKAVSAQALSTEAVADAEKPAAPASRDEQAPDSRKA
jgi:hypothetical protein